MQCGLYVSFYIRPAFAMHLHVRENITKRRARSLSTNTFAFNILLFYVSFLDKRKKTMIVV